MPKRARAGGGESAGLSGARRGKPRPTSQQLAFPAPPQASGEATLEAMLEESMDSSGQANAGACESAWKRPAAHAEPMQQPAEQPVPEVAPRSSEIAPGSREAMPATPELVPESPEVSADADAPGAPEAAQHAVAHEAVRHARPAVHEVPAASEWVLEASAEDAPRATVAAAVPAGTPPTWGSSGPAPPPACSLPNCIPPPPPPGWPAFMGTWPPSSAEEDPEGLLASLNVADLSDVMSLGLGSLLLDADEVAHGVEKVDDPVPEESDKKAATFDGLGRPEACPPPCHWFLLAQPL